MTKTVCMFTGQAAQYKNMGKDIYSKSEYARKMFDKASEIFNEDLADIAFKKPFAELRKTHYAQILITLLNIIYFDLSRNKIQPDIVIGFSIGELAALYAAKVINLEDLLRLVTLRGKHMHEDAKNNKGCMYAISSIHDTDIEEIIQKLKGDNIITISNYNSVNQTIIAGDKPTLEQVLNEIKKRKGKITDLKQEGAWHTRHMLETKHICQKFLNTIELKKPEIPVLFNLTADFEDDPAKIKNLIVNQIIYPVKWKQTLFQLKELGVSMYYEVGPGKILRGLILSNFLRHKEYKYKVYNINSPDSLENIPQQMIKIIN